MKSRSRHAFSLAELILSLGFIALAILTFLGLATIMMRTDSKALETASGALVADQVIERAIARLKANPGLRQNFWKNDHVVWLEDEVVKDATTYYFKVSTTTVLGVGEPSLKNRLKKVDVHVWWAGEEEQVRQGKGRLEVTATRLVSEADTIAGATPDA